MARNELEIIIRLRDLATRALGKARRAVEGLERELKDAKKAADRLNKALRDAEPASQRLAFALGAAAGAVGGLGVKAVATAGQFEQMQIAFTTMLGSAQKADAFLRQLYDFAARTPFEIEGLQRQTQLLLALGFNAEDVIPILTAVGDAVAGLGGSAELLNRVVLALGQMRSKGKVSAEEMRQLAEAGIPAWEMLAKAIGTDIPTAMKMAEKGAIDATTGINAILIGMQQRFRGMMDMQSRTILGIWSNIQDSLTYSLAALGDALDRTFDIRGKMQEFLDWLNKVRDWLEDDGPRRALEKYRQLIIDVAGAITGALVPALVSATRSLTAFLLRLAPWAVAGYAAVKLLQALGISFDDLKRFAALGAQAISGLVDILRGLASNVRGIFEVWRSTIGGMIQGLSEAIDYISKGDLAGAFDAIATQFSEAAKRGQEQAEKYFKRGAELVTAGLFRISNAVTGKLDEVGEKAKKLLQQIQQDAEDALKTIQIVAGGATAGAGADGGAVKVPDFIAKERQQLRYLEAAYKAGIITRQRYRDTLNSIINMTDMLIQRYKDNVDIIPDLVNLYEDANKALETLKQTTQELGSVTEEAIPRAVERFNDFSGSITNASEKLRQLKLEADLKEFRAIREAERALDRMSKAAKRADLVERMFSFDRNKFEAKVGAATATWKARLARATWEGIEEGLTRLAAKGMIRLPSLAAPGMADFGAFIRGQDRGSFADWFQRYKAQQEQLAKASALTQAEKDRRRAAQEIAAMPGPPTLLERLGQQVTGALGSLAKTALEVINQLNPFAAILQKINPIGTIISAMLERLAPAIQPLVDVFSAIGQKLGAVLEPLLQAIEPFVEKLGEALQKMVEAIEPIIEPLSGLFNMLIDAMAKVSEAIRPLAQAFMELLGTVLDALMPILKPLLQIVADLARIIAAVLTPVIKALIPAFRFVGEVFRTVARVVAGIWNAIASVVNTLLGWLGVHIEYIKLETEKAKNTLKQRDQTSGAGNQAAGDNTKTIRYELPTAPVLAAPKWVDEMGKHVARFGEAVDRFAKAKIVVDVRASDGLAWSVRGMA